jgi:hypothetical protein
MKYGVLKSDLNVLRKSFLKEAKPAIKYPQFHKFAQNKSKKVNDLIIIDNVYYQFESREKILKLLEEHIRCNLIQVIFFILDILILKKKRLEEN